MTHESASYPIRRRRLEWTPAATLVVALSLFQAAPARAVDVAIYAADYYNFTDDVHEKIEGTGLFDTVDSFDVTTFTPTLAELQAYDAVLVYSQLEFSDPDGMGDVLADYLDAGSGVVLCGGSYDDGADWEIRGRLVNDAYLTFAQADVATGAYLSLVEDVPGHALLDGVNTFDGGAQSVHHAPTATVAGAVQVARWSNDEPLIAYWAPTDGIFVGLNFFPVSDDAYPGYGLWNPSTDGDRMMANALLVAAGCDVDGDGHLDMACGGGDCDDQDASIHPGAAEIRDGIDQDCDLMVDEGVLPDGALIVTEIMRDPDLAADDYGEWIEVYNTTAIPMDLYGLEVTDLGTNAFIVDVSLPLAPHTAALLARSSNPTLNGGIAPDFEWSNFQLSNSDDEVILTHDGVELDRVEFWDPDWPDTAGAAMSLAPSAYEGVLNDNPASWCDATTPFGFGDLGTPGQTNPICCLDADGDGYLDAGCGGDDCDDGDPGVNPGETETACNGVDDDCDGMLHPEEADADGDGFSECDGDCDDIDAGVNPGVAEQPCTGFDDDCDGALHPSEIDADGDGFSPCDGDCDDAEPATRPGADELCDGVDNDCDGETDEDSAIDVEDWWVDVDGDGYGDAAVLDQACYQPGGFTDNPDDCDDADAAAHPGAAEVHDAADNDCDGFYDEGVLPPDALVVTEILQNPSAVLDDVGEWFEVVNNTALPMNLVGLEVSDLGTNLFTVLGDLWIDPDEHLVFGASDDPAVNGGAYVSYAWDEFNLGNGDDEIILEHAGDVLDEVQYDGGALWIDPTGASMSLDPTLYTTADNDDPTSWCESTSAFGLGDLGSPADVNPTCCPDADGDGFLDAACGFDDCDDDDPAVFPGAEEICNGLDDDCDAATDELVDADGDGWTLCDGDCDDDDPAILPGADEVCDGMDNDCDPTTDEDVDGDGDSFTICDGDCDDTHDLTYPGAAEICDGLDNDCDGTLAVDEVDEDGDGVLLCDDGLVGPDCDDNDATVYPDAPELCDGLDNDCDSLIDEDTEADDDGDGFNLCQGDCDDTNADTYPGADELCDGLDNDCDAVVPDDELDDDGDGWRVCDGDCDDTDAALHLDDLDADGFSTCDGDCDDDDDTIHPDADEICDGLDNDCDGQTDDSVDDDGDGFLPIDCGGDDCDDTDDTIHPDATEDCEDGLDNDCDGNIDTDDDECATPDDDDDSADFDASSDCECDGSGSGSSGSAALVLLFALAAVRRRGRCYPR